MLKFVRLVQLAVHTIKFQVTLHPSGLVWYAPTPTHKQTFDRDYIVTAAQAILMDSWAVSYYERFCWKSKMNETGHGRHACFSHLFKAALNKETRVISQGGTELSNMLSNSESPCLFMNLRVQCMDLFMSKFTNDFCQLTSSIMPSD